MITTWSTTKAAQTIPLSAPHMAGNEWCYVREAIESGWVSTAGPHVERFEAAVARRALVRYGIATSSGTAALHTALIVAGIEADDEVLVSTLTFIASANAIRYAGAHPVLIDAEPNYWQIDPHRIEEFLTQRCEVKNGVLVNRSTGRRVKGIVPVHIMGHPVDLDAIYDLARRFGLVVIEDAAEAIGADYKARPVGRTDSIAVYSFNGNKIITAGGGGMILTDRPDWAERAKYLTTQAKDEPIEYIHGAIGFNYRLTNMQAALGLAQLESLEEFVAYKRSIAWRYQSHLADVPGITTMPEAAWARGTYWLYTLLIDPDKFGSDSRELANRLQSLGIQTRPLWQPMHMSKPHGHCEAIGGEVAQRLFRQSISIPCSVDLDLDGVDEIANIIRSCATG